MEFSLKIHKGEQNETKKHIQFVEGNGQEVKFWTNLWNHSTSLAKKFRILFNISARKNATIAEVYHKEQGNICWNLTFQRGIKD